MVPSNALPRTDLPYLRRRARPVVVVAPAAAPSPTAVAPAALAPAAVPVTAERALRPFARTRFRAVTALTPKTPTVTLTRLQSGVGMLQIEAACGDAVGDLRIGCAYQLTSGVTSVVARTSGVNLGPPGSSRPVLVARRAQFEELVVDLAQVRDLERLVVYLYSESDAALRWGGTLVVTTFGQAEIRLALDRAQSTGVMVALSVYRLSESSTPLFLSTVIGGEVITSATLLLSMAGPCAASW